ncbi:putative uncharacterized protein [Eubacterium sp. CAG:786]|nr:putative uncharacterized protein [Eubacterium sp. CAG:786]
MAAITPRKNKSGEIISYTIRVYRGYDSSGNRLKPYTMTYKPEPSMTAKQVEKELNRQAVQFEEKCMRGSVADPTIRLCDFCARSGFATSAKSILKSQRGRYRLQHMHSIRSR